MFQEPTESSKQPIRTRYLGHVTVYQPIRDQYFLIRSVPDPNPVIGCEERPDIIKLGRLSHPNSH